MRNSFDYIVIDTRGGFDTTSVVPDIVSDAYCIILEADEISVQQVYGLKKKIDECSQLLKGSNRLKGFIVNKALYAPSDKGFVLNVARIYGGLALGTVPADKLAIKSYQKKNLAIDVAPESDFAYYAIDVINNLVAEDQVKRTKTETVALADVGRNIRRRWRLRSFSLNGLKRNLLNCPGGGHANIVAVFNILRQAPVSRLLPFSVSGSFEQGYTYSRDSTVTIDTTSGLVVSANITVSGPTTKEVFSAAPVYNTNSMWQWQNQGSLRGSLDLQEKEHSFTDYPGGQLTHAAYWSPALGHNVNSTDTQLRRLPSSEATR